MTTSLRRPGAAARHVAMAALTFVAGSCLAESAAIGGEGLRISGFGSVGVTHAAAPEGWGYRRDIGQPAHDGGTRGDTDTRLGLQLNYAAGSQVELVTQLMATRRSPHARGGDGIAWAFAAWRPNAVTTLRAGRVNVDAFLMSDHRDVGFAYLLARPPVEFYGSLPSSLDGADLTRVWNVDGTLWRAKAFVGSTSGGDLGANGRTDLRPGYGVIAAREKDGLLVRLSLIRVKFATSPPALQPLFDALDGLKALPLPDIAAQAAALRAELDPTGALVSYAALGVSGEQLGWLWSGELTRVTGHRTASFTAGYATLGRRLGSVTIYGAASGIFNSASAATPPDWATPLTPLIGPAGAAQVQMLATGGAYALNKTGADQRTLSAGARWDLHPQVALKAQWDHVRFQANGGRLWANATLDRGSANVASVVLDFIF